MYSTKRYSILFIILLNFKLLYFNQYRDLYYQFKELFENQTVLNNMIDDIAFTFNVKRTRLHIVFN